MKRYLGWMLLLGLIFSSSAMANELQNFKAQTPDAQTVESQDYLGKHPTLVTFWGTY